MKKEKEIPRYKVVTADSNEELQRILNAEKDYQLVDLAVVTYWMHMVVIHEYTAVLCILHNCE